MKAGAEDLYIKVSDWIMATVVLDMHECETHMINEYKIISY